MHALRAQLFKLSPQGFPHRLTRQLDMFLADGNT